MILALLAILSMLSCAFFGFITGLAMGYGGGYEQALNDTKK